MDGNTKRTLNDFINWLFDEFGVYRGGYTGCYDVGPHEVFEAYLIYRKTGDSQLRHLDVVHSDANKYPDAYRWRGWAEGEYEACAELMDGNTEWLVLTLPQGAIDRFNEQKHRIESGLLKKQRRQKACQVTSKPEVRQRIFDRDGEVCKECGAVDDLTLDHIIAVANGGTDNDDNLCVLCRSCNSRKGAR